jgi:hypothetical protein
MNLHLIKLPVIIDLQPEPEEPLLRLPAWMKYLFVVLYLGTLVGLGLLLKESVGFFRLYQAKVQAMRIAEETTRKIAGLNQQLAEHRATQRTYEVFKLRQRQVARPGPLLNWLPSLVGKTQCAHSLTLQQAGDRVQGRLLLEKPVNDPVVSQPKPPPDYQLLSAGEETPKYNELPANQKPNPNNEFTALAVQLRKP